MVKLLGIYVNGRKQDFVLTLQIDTNEHNDFYSSVIFCHVSEITI